MTHRLDGKFSKYKTRDCGEKCPHYKHMKSPGRDESHPLYMLGDEIEIDEEQCHYGVAWKLLIEKEEPKHCQYFKKEDIKNTK